MIVDPNVVRLLAEGGIIEVFGYKAPNGSWSFIGVVGSMELDTGGATAGTPRCSDLSLCVPSNWISFIPIKVHPELRDWFRTRYDEAVAALPAHRQESHLQYRHYKWQAMFASTPPDRWSEDEF